jgi:hypothetical protein
MLPYGADGPSAGGSDLTRQRDPAVCSMQYLDFSSTLQAGRLPPGSGNIANSTRQDR